MLALNDFMCSLKLRDVRSWTAQLAPAQGPSSWLPLHLLWGQSREHTGCVTNFFQLHDAEHWTSRTLKSPQAPSLCPSSPRTNSHPLILWSSGVVTTILAHRGRPSYIHGCPHPLIVVLTHLVVLTHDGCSSPTHDGNLSTVHSCPYPFIAAPIYR